MLANRRHRDIGPQRKEPHSNDKEDRTKDKGQQRSDGHRHKRETDGEDYRRNRQDRFQSLFHF